MNELPFRADVVGWLADHRSGWLTPVLQGFTGLGEIEGYILVVVLIFVAFDKQLAVRLAVLTLLVMSLNHALKTLIGNPRPFVSDGTYAQRWAVSSARAADLVTEYSTPSGHAMAGASFYTYLALATGSRVARVAFVLCILLIGLSRPYLGVHYVEDVLSGWVLGLMVALVAVRHGDRLAAAWGRLGYGRQVAALLGASLAVWLVTWAASDWSAAAPPSAFVSYAGLLTGILIAQPLEARTVGFDPRQGGPGIKLARFVVCVAMVLGGLALLGVVFGAIADPHSPLGHGLRFVRYTSAGLIGLFLAPLLFERLGLT